VSKAIKAWICRRENPAGARNEALMQQDNDLRVAEYGFVDGSAYNGQWKKAKFNGPGLFISGNGSVFEGNFENGALNGKGKVQYNTGEKYEGDWSKDLPNGKGNLVYGNGRTYSGEWAIGKKKRRWNPTVGERRYVQW